MRSRLGSGALRREDGLTLIELLVVLLIMVVVIGAIADLFVSGIRSQADQTTRAQGQIDARMALDEMRREIHCATAVSPNPNANWPTGAVTITLGSWCGTSLSGSIVSVTWCTTGSGPYNLYRYPHATDLSGGLYSAACTDTGSGGRLWVHDVVDASGVSGGKIFTSSQASTAPAFGAADISYGTSVGSIPTGTYAYIVDPVLNNSGTYTGEQPGTEAAVTIPSGASGKSLSVSWSTACNAYPYKANITSFKVYGRSPGAEQYLGSVTSTGCAATTLIPDDTGATTPSGAFTSAKLSSLAVTLPVRADSSSLRLITLTDTMTLRNTPR